MPNCENPLLMGKGMLLTSVPRNRVLSTGRNSETMPTREGGHTAAERHDVASDVTHRTKAVANAGRSVAAGKPFSNGGDPVRRLIIDVFQMLQTGSVAQVESGGFTTNSLAAILQGSGKPFARNRWCCTQMQRRKS